MLLRERRFLPLFLQGLNSALFGPIKYAILLGTVLGTLLAGTPNATGFITLACLCIAVTGYLASRSILVPRLPAPCADW